jgi:hypothetical protein
MIFKEDIIQQLKLDFKESADKAVEILNNAISKTDYLKTDRIIRCIIFLADGNINNLKKYIDNAIFDPRDVMLWAEYENLNNKDFKYKRVRDFNKTFEKCTENVTD